MLENRTCPSSRFSNWARYWYWDVECRDSRSQNRPAPARRVILSTLSSQFLPVVRLLVAAAVLACELHEKVFQRAANGVQGNYLSAGEPYLFDDAALLESGYGNLDKTILF